MQCEKNIVLMILLSTVKLCIWTQEFIFISRAVSDVLVNLKGIASEMGNELDRQNVQLDNINGEVNKDAIHLDQGITRMQRLTKNS